ncbi:hypothetical protein AG1IA_10108 [Rhizoctonia solani AG-1 IA]|uniref:Uncharacterized protein n=1 Tax=Thanatephorus cucumeris (strain AG1-IA) TaxID=983506 RepID=L8WGM1_THACA|nr:hypothetical protein AG1IA_10108 [Rhizoctonia solani AG-1 IA]
MLLARQLGQIACAHDDRDLGLAALALLHVVKLLVVDEKTRLWRCPVAASCHLSPDHKLLPLMPLRLVTAACLIWSHQLLRVRAWGRMPGALRVSPCVPIGVGLFGRGCVLVELGLDSRG